MLNISFYLQSLAQSPVKALRSVDCRFFESLPFFLLVTPQQSNLFPTYYTNKLNKMEMTILFLHVCVYTMTKKLLLFPSIPALLVHPIRVSADVIACVILVA